MRPQEKRTTGSQRTTGCKENPLVHKQKLPNNITILEHIENGIEHLATFKHPPELKNYTAHKKDIGPGGCVIGFKAVL